MEDVKGGQISREDKLGTEALLPTVRRDFLRYSRKIPGK